MDKPSRRQLTVAGLAIGTAAAATVVAITVAGTAGASGRSGTIYTYGTPGLDGPNGTVIITGAIGDYGTTTKADRNGQVDPSGKYSLAQLKNGTVLSDPSAVSAKIQAGTPNAKIDPVSCSLQGSVSAPVPIIFGTGSYAGITGTLNTTFTIAELAARTSSGTCDTNADPIDVYATVFSTGVVHLPH